MRYLNELSANDAMAILHDAILYPTRRILQN